jgi:hypothetical protein
MRGDGGICADAAANTMHNNATERNATKSIEARTSRQRDKTKHANQQQPNSNSESDTRVRFDDGLLDGSAHERRLVGAVSTCVCVCVRDAVSTNSEVTIRSFDRRSTTTSQLEHRHR